MTIPISLVVAHFVGDFLLQSNWMALNKSKNWKALSDHCAMYSLCFLWLGVWFFTITFLTHLITDAITSRITSKLWFIPLSEWYDKEKEDVCFQAFPKPHLRHWFFVMIGLDQLIHFFTLAFTYQWLF